MDPARIEDVAATVIRANGATASLALLEDPYAVSATLRIVADYDRELLIRIAAGAIAHGAANRLPAPRPPRRRGDAC